jgi:hypothetical protein
MASGDLTASSGALCLSISALETHISTLNLPADTDKIYIVPVNGRDNAWISGRVVREA